MNEGLILAIDCGTQSVRALLFDKLGNLIGKEQEHFEPYFLRHQAGLSRIRKYSGRAPAGSVRYSRKKCTKTGTG